MKYAVKRTRISIAGVVGTAIRGRSGLCGGCGGGRGDDRGDDGSSCGSGGSSDSSGRGS